MSTLKKAQSVVLIGDSSIRAYVQKLESLLNNNYEL